MRRLLLPLALGTAWPAIAQMPAQAPLDRLAADLDSGEWERRNGHLLELDELDLGYRLVIGDTAGANS